MPTYMQLGFEHILDLGAYDHMLFLLVLVAPFGLKNWKALLALVTAFTLGHASTIVLTTMDLVSVKSAIVELAIAITILISAIYHYFHASTKVNLYVYAVTLIFGCIHGLGFASYLSSMLGDKVLMPLIGFNLGVELGQVIFVLLILIVRQIATQLLNLNPKWWRLSVCGLGIILALMMVIERI